MAPYLEEAAAAGANLNDANQNTPAWMNDLDLD